MSNAAIHFDTEPFDASMPRPMGRNSAGEGFLRGLLAHADVERFYLWNSHNRKQSELEALIERLGPPSAPVEWFARGDRARVQEAGALFIPTPELQREAWARRAFGGTAYSLTGVTHTIAETYIMDEISSLLLAPIEPWDALICTSSAGQKAVETLLEAVAAYFQERFGATRIAPAQLVTIPLGVHVEDFQPPPGARARWRDRLGIPEDAPAALHLGRFSTTTKMHPGPMGLALQDAAQRLGTSVYWILFGGAPRPKDEEDFLRAAAAFCPDVKLCPVGDTSATTRDEIVSAADVFLSLSDNIQETFGLTPLEAMAAGLPCVISDWDGYKMSVRHGVDGFRIPTLTPRPGLGADLAYAHADRMVNYETYAGVTALFTAVDVDQAAEALTLLFSKPDVRRQMGEAAKRRAAQDFDWRVIIPQYQALWSELERRRLSAVAQGPLENPYRLDPFRMFAAYPSAALQASEVVALQRPFAPGEASEWLSRAGVRSAAGRLPTDLEIEDIVRRLTVGPRSLGALLAEVSADRRTFVERGVLWMAKFGVVRLGRSPPRS